VSPVTDLLHAALRRDFADGVRSYHTVKEPQQLTVWDAEAQYKARQQAALSAIPPRVPFPDDGTRFSPDGYSFLTREEAWDAWGRHGRNAIREWIGSAKAGDSFQDGDLILCCGTVEELEASK
jgi:hypothetical protein